MFDLKKIILDLIFPIECLNCGLGGDWFCPKCLAKIEINELKIFNLVTELNEIKIGYLGNYESELEKIIVNYKYQFILDLENKVDYLLEKFFEKKENFNFFSGAQFLIPVPLSKKRLIWRGFNQSEVIAEMLACRLNIPVNRELILRKLNTRPQVGLNQEKRRINLKNAFQSMSLIGVNKVVLIDDVVTTGSTILECAKSLKMAGISEIKAFVLAKG